MNALLRGRWAVAEIYEIVTRYGIRERVGRNKWTGAMSGGGVLVFEVKCYLASNFNTSRLAQPWSSGSLVE
jgi:hypothetical protein